MAQRIIIDPEDTEHLSIIEVTKFFAKRGYTLRSEPDGNLYVRPSEDAGDPATNETADADTALNQHTNGELANGHRANHNGSD